LAELQGAIEALAREEREATARLRARQEEAERLGAALATADRDEAVMGERERALKERLGEMGRDRRLMLRELESAQEEERALADEVTHLREEAQALQAEVDRLEAAQAAERQRRRAVEERLAQVRRELSSALARCTQAESERAAALRRGDELTRLLEETTAALEGEAAAREARSAEVGRLAQAAKQASQALAQARQELEERRGALSQVQQELAQAQRRARAIEEEEQALRARLSLLARMQRESYYPGVREVLALAEGDADSGIIGAVGSLLQVPAELEVAIEAALGGRLQQVVVRRWSDAERAIAHLKRQRSGRVTFLPLETIRPPSPVRLPRFAGLLGVAADLVGIEPGLETVRQYLLNRILVVEDLAAARKALEWGSSEGRGSFTVATLGGEVAQSSGSVTGGGEQRSRSALLERERERRSLPAQVRQRRSEREAILAQAQALRSSLEEAEQALAEAEARAQEARLAAEAAQGEDNRARLELRRSEERLQWQQARLAELERERAGLVRRAEAAAERAAAAEGELERLQGLARQLEGELAAGSEEHDASGGMGEPGLQVQRVRLGALQERVGQVSAALQGVRQRRARLSARLEERVKHLGALREELAGVQAARRAAQEQRAQLRAALEALEAAIRPERDRLAAQQGQREALEDMERLRRQRHLEFSQVFGQAEMAARREEDALEALRAAALEEMDEEEVRRLTELQGEPETDNGLSMEELEAQVEALRRRCRAMGGVNPNAPQEHAELEERYQFLASQASDLEQAASSLRQVIEELEQTMEQRFRQTYEQVAGRFEVYFRELFAGGSARLSLSDPDDLSSTGVEVTVRPPGKRSQDLALLSGGERALTSVALLFALLEASGTPFCVMDEVDAMLDEANVGRFRRVLQSLATRTQFIIISHNRHTIEAADVIYGITMGEDGTSRTLSLMLDEAKQVVAAG
ncbi:MAG: hypothetical protein ACOYEW_14085, partial [Anaerolineae bacterium]|jgi:chromosome segregation protein